MPSRRRIGCLVTALLLAVPGVSAAEAEAASRPDILLIRADTLRWDHLGAYVAAKDGVDTLAKTGAAEYSARGIRVKSIPAEGFETPAIEGYFRQLPEIGERTIATHALRRLGKPEEVAELVVWLASDPASFFTGTCLTCDGDILVNSHML